MGEEKDFIIELRILVIKLVGSSKNVLDSVLFLRAGYYRLKVGFYLISWFLLSWSGFLFLASVALALSFVSCLRLLVS